MRRTVYEKEGFQMVGNSKVDRVAKITWKKITFTDMPAIISPVNQ
jgi:hypothetical protein